MKKLSLLLIVLAIVTMSSAALADGPLDGIPGEGYWNHVEDNGEVFWSAINTNGEFDNVEMDRSGYYFDENGKNGQATEMKLQTWAFIPCYLEMTVTGNQGQTVVKSFGPGASTNAGLVTAYVLAFDNEIGGFVNEAWDSLGHGRNAEVEPAEGTYIQGCDIFRVELYANDDYKYEVVGAPLAPTNANVDSDFADDFLPLQMRSSIDGAAFGAAISFETEEEVTIISQKAACEESLVYHQFRVPYNRNIAHGRYDGKVIFRAATL